MTDQLSFLIASTTSKRLCIEMTGRIVYGSKSRVFRLAQDARSVALARCEIAYHIGGLIINATGFVVDIQKPRESG